MMDCKKCSHSYEDVVGLAQCGADVFELPNTLCVARRALHVLCRLTDALECAVAPSTPPVEKEFKLLDTKDKD